MKIDDFIFRAYDIRGYHATNLVPEVAEVLGRAYIALTGAKRISLGWDMRETSPGLVEGFIKGVTSMGAEVIKIGMCTTPMIYYSVGMYDDIDGGVMVTASHSTAEWNGIKMTRGDLSPIGKGSGMEELKELAQAGEFNLSDTPGSVSERDIKKDFLDKLFAYTGEIDASKMTIVADAGNGVTPVILPKFFERLGSNTVDMYWKPDGSFPNHEANPLKLDTLVDMQKSVLENGAAFGVAYDADGDRVGFVDENAKYVPSDIVATMIALEMLKKNPGAKILCDVRCTRDVKRVVEKNGGEYAMSPVGHAYIKQQMRKEGALFAGELSGHFYYAEMFMVESTLLSTMLIVKLMNETGKKLSELVSEIRTHEQSGEINYVVRDKDATMKSLRDYHAEKGGKVSDLDGYTVSFDTWWFNIRPSANDPVLRLNVESETAEEMEIKRDEIIAMIESDGGELE
ncbi:phosphomannomutase/phosphoglucomutase [Candidatus Uhrbacteria bacterium]|jgi:phosphomannomutase|nr:phosphomannomutase/phosphoglucomutase [Candidatus Uhrbacteria bacterium]